MTRYKALACDYDGTIAERGKVAQPTVDALLLLQQTGWRLLLVTGRILDDVLEIFPKFDLFDWIVAENGALIYRPFTREVRLLGAPPPADFVLELTRIGVPISVGRIIVATVVPHDRNVTAAIDGMGLDLQVIYNKGAVMVLPTGIDKVTGLKAALADANIGLQETVGVGDAENDEAFLSICGLSVAVANALPALKEKVDLVTQNDHGAGVAELVEGLLRPQENS